MNQEKIRETALSYVNLELDTEKEIASKRDESEQETSSVGSAASRSSERSFDDESSDSIYEQRSENEEFFVDEEILNS